MSIANKIEKLYEDLLDVTDNFKLEDAYWISPKGKILGFSLSTHIKEVLASPESFGITREYIDETFKKHNEKIGIEGKAREEIIRKIFNKGWIRIRKYRQFWSVTFNNLTNRERDYIQDFTKKAIEKGVSPFEEIRLDCTQKSIYSTFKDIAEDYLYMSENKKPDKKRFSLIS